MSPSIPPLTERPAWKALEEHYRKVKDVRLRELFSSDHQRGQRLAAEAVGIYFDYSKNRVTDETLALLVRLAEESGLAARIEAMFRGEKINVTEAPRRAARCLAGPARDGDRGRRRERRARRARRARQDGQLL